MRAGKRLARVAQALAERDRAGRAPLVVVYLPRKDGDKAPVGVVSDTGTVRTVRYDLFEPRSAAEPS